MRVTSLELTNYRNYSELALNPGSGLNVIVGENAQGKSNLLETFYVLATTKSLRAGKDSEMVKFAEEFARIVAFAERENDIDVSVELLISATDKKISKVNGVKKTKLSEVAGQINASIFESADLDIVRGEPLIRRRFLDLEIGQTSPRYITTLAAYRKVLEQRNSLLRSMREERSSRSYSLGVLSAYDEQLADHGSVLIERRLAFTDRLSAIATDIHRFLSDTRDALDLIYVPSFDLRGSTLASEIKESFLDQILILRQDEEIRGKTLLGPQRDDLRLNVNDQDSRSFASQGQQRTIALSLKLAEGRLIEELAGEAPLLLLDDVLSDLDDIRRHKLFEHVATSGSQTFLTCPNLGPIPKSMLDNACIWTVEAGKVKS